MKFHEIVQECWNIRIYGSKRHNLAEYLDYDNRTQEIDLLDFNRHVLLKM